MEFNERVTSLSKELNIDLSLFYFSLLDNRSNKINVDNLGLDEADTLRILNETGI